MEVLLGNVHRKGHDGVCCRDAVHDGGQGAHGPLLRRVGGAQKICKHTAAACLVKTRGVCTAWVRGCAHPRCCSSVCTVRGCCSTLGCCSRCCLSWARWMTTPVTMAMRTQALLSFIHCYDTAYPPGARQHTLWGRLKATHALPALPVTLLLSANVYFEYLFKERMFYYHGLKEDLSSHHCTKVVGTIKDQFCDWSANHSLQSDVVNK